MVRVYHPKIEIRLIKVVRRKEIVTKVPIALDRAGAMDGVDLTPYLGDHGGVTVTKSVREPAGAFSITLSDKPHDKYVESLYALIEPMDMVEIRMAHDPSEYAKADKGYRPPVVMRGFVSTVTRSRVMTGGSPVRTVTIAGQDMGKVLQTLQIFYLNNSVVGENIMSPLAFFHKYAPDGEAKIKDVGAFVESFLQEVINPYLGTMLGLADGRAVGAKVVNKWTAKVSAIGSVSPHTISTFNNTSAYAMLYSILDTGAFNEVFVEDGEDAINFVVRPVPFKHISSGDFIQDGAWADAVSITDEDVLGENLTRSDGSVANYYWVSNNRWLMYQNESAKRLASVGSESSFILFDYFNSAANIYGVRKMEVETVLGDPAYGQRDAAKAEQLPTDTDALAAWIEKRRDALAKMNMDNVVFESGALQLRGNEKIKAGMYLNVKSGSFESSFYVHQVTHSFTPYQAFMTSVSVDRGTSFIKRVQSAVPVYYSEVNGGGVK